MLDSWARTQNMCQTVILGALYIVLHTTKLYMYRMIQKFLIFREYRISETLVWTNCQVPDIKVHVIRDIECWLHDFSWCGHRRKADPSLFFELYQMLPWTDLEISALNSLSFRTVAAEFLSFTVDAGFEVSTNVPLHEGSSSDMS